MKDFLHIETLFDNIDDRNSPSLLDLYDSLDKLEIIVENIIKKSLSDKYFAGKKILLKPNWVFHSRFESDELCLRTNNNFVLATLKVLLKMGPSEIVIGDAPIQGCQWDSIVTKSFLDEIFKLQTEYQISVKVTDFRRRIYSISNNAPKNEVKPISNYIIFDLANNSYLEPITESGKSKFRVTNYDPDRMAMAHSPGIHQYCIAREFLEADIVISLPKIKTHQKTGITGALKNIVGINGDKDFLPHHRIGGAKLGGDCYPGGSYLRYWSELSLDMANRNQGNRLFWLWQKTSSLLWRMSFPGPVHNISAGWYGNDTTWRMVMDLNLIAHYGNTDGTLSRIKKRRIFSLSDGIIAGQGNGPLFPKPLPLGIVMFTDNSALNDTAVSILFGFNFTTFPLICEAQKLLLNENSSIYLNNSLVDLLSLEKISIKTKPPIGWEPKLRME